MAFAQSTVVNVFDKYHLLLSPKLKSYQDGPPGWKVTFITDPNETFMISFEEGMPCMDLATLPDSILASYISSESQSNGRYIHQQRTDPETRPQAGNFAFFHMKVPDKDGAVHILPGQMTAPYGYPWSDGVESVLIDHEWYYRLQQKRLRLNCYNPAVLRP